MLSNDRGDYIRDKEGYVNNMKEHFQNVNAFMHNDLTKITYNHCICKCTQIN